MTDLANPALISGGETRRIRAGFIPLVDAAVLIAAEQFGFAAREGLSLDLVKDISWSNIRDRLAFRQFDVAHMLSPMPVAAMLGLGSNPSPVIAPMSLGRGGNAITLSVRLYQRMADIAGLDNASSAAQCARALAMVIHGMRQAGEPLLTLGMTYPFSSHNYEFRYWLAAGGIDPDRDVKLVVVPPPMTSDALAAGAIDGFCVGAPWNMIASHNGVGRIVATKNDIWPSAPEKVLGVRPDWAVDNADTMSRLLVALDRAARWADLPENYAVLAEALSEPRYLDTPADILRPVLSGEFIIDATGGRRVIDRYISFHRDFALYPQPSHALWIYSQMIRWGQVVYSDEGRAQAMLAYRPDLYRHALGEAAAPREADLRTEGDRDGDHFMDGHVFDPTQIPAYVAGFAVRTRRPAGEN